MARKSVQGSGWDGVRTKLNKDNMQNLVGHIFIRFYLTTRTLNNLPHEVTVFFTLELYNGCSCVESK